MTPKQLNWMLCIKEEIEYMNLRQKERKSKAKKDPLE